MQDTNSLKQLFELLAQLYEAEGRHGGDEAAIALRSALSAFPSVMPEPYNCLPGVAEAALALDPHPDAVIVARALPSIRWFHVVDSLQSIGSDMGNRMLVCELLGPNGMVFHEKVRVGLFVQCANLDYVTRSHTAEETYVILGGEGYWSKGKDGPVLKKAGESVFHPSAIPHASRTADKPTIAAWRWSGDIRYDTYACAG